MIFSRGCKHEHRHEEVGKWVTVTSEPSRDMPHQNVCLMDQWVVCEDCGARDLAMPIKGSTTKPPGRYPTS